MNPNIFDTKLENSDLQKLIDELLIEITKNTKDTTPLFQLITIYKKLERHVDIVNTCTMILDIDPKNTEILFEKNSTQAIINESQLDVYASTNTYMDPWF